MVRMRPFPLSAFNALLSNAALLSSFHRLLLCFLQSVVTGRHKPPIEIFCYAFLCNVLQLAACCILLKLAPLPLKHTPSYEFTTSFLGVAFGISMGINASYRHGYLSGSLVPRLVSLDGLIAIARRVAVGESHP
jgi:hypothetical protein